MGVQIGIGEGKERELVDRLRDDARRIPEPPVVREAQRLLAAQPGKDPIQRTNQLGHAWQTTLRLHGAARGKLIKQQLDCAEVADDGYEEGRREAAEQG